MSVAFDDHGEIVPSQTRLELALEMRRDVAGAGYDVVDAGDANIIPAWIAARATVGVVLNAAVARRAMIQLLRLSFIGEIRAAAMGS